MKDMLAFLLHFLRVQTVRMKQLKASLCATKSQLIKNQKSTGAANRLHAQTAGGNEDSCEIFRGELLEEI